MWCTSGNLYSVTDHNSVTRVKKARPRPAGSSSRSPPTLSLVWAMKKAGKPADSAGAPPKGGRRSTKRTEAEVGRSPKKGEPARVRVEHHKPQPDPAPSAKEIREHRRGKAVEAARKYYNSAFGPPGRPHVLSRACVWANSDKIKGGEFIWTAQNLAPYNRAELARRAANSTLPLDVAATPADLREPVPTPR